MTQETPWWDRQRHADRVPLLHTRGRIKTALRNWFETNGFTEVEAGALQISPGNETHLHAFQTRFVKEDGADSGDLYLHTSPEFACKKLLAAGETKIFDFARVYRNRESGPLHAPEFTMLEWYRANAAWDAVVEDTLSIVRLAAEIAGAARFVWRGRACNPESEPERLTLAEAFRRYASINLDAVLEDRNALATALIAQGVRVTPTDTWSDLFSRVLVERIEPNLGEVHPTILCAYPVSEAALARPLPEDPRFAERFELYVCGVELSNGFGELTDPVEQRRRFEGDMAEKQALYGERYPIDEDFLAALAHMPPASGVALGFDRLVMLATGASRIDDVLWTPPFRPV